MATMNNKTFLLVSVLIALMAGVASRGGLFVEGLYRDNDLVVSAWQGNDLVTLFLVVPMLLVSLFYSLRDSKRGRLFWMGSLWYMVYNYTFYLFGAAFNEFFLLYVALFVLSTSTLIFALIGTNVQEFSPSYSEKLPYRTVSGFMLLFAALLGGMWIALSLVFVFTGQVHESITQTGHPTAVVFAVDLTLLIPSMILGGALLWRKNPWGPIVGSVVLVKASAYGLALIVMTARSYANMGVVDPFLALWIFLTLGCSAALFLLMRNIGRK